MESIAYPGDHAKDLHNRILGPDANGDFFVVTGTSYENDTTTATLRQASNTEVDDCDWDKSGNRVLSTD